MILRVAAYPQLFMGHEAGRLSRVGALDSLQTTLHCGSCSSKSATVHRARKRPVPRVDTHVSVQMSLEFSVISTAVHGTRERPLPRVSAHV